MAPCSRRIACATALVPSAKAGHFKHAHRAVPNDGAWRRFALASANINLHVLGPMSSRHASRRAQLSEYTTALWLALAVERCRPPLKSTGQQQLDAARFCAVCDQIRGQSSSDCPRRRSDLPISYPLALIEGVGHTAADDRGNRTCSNRFCDDRRSCRRSLRRRE